MNIVKAKYSEAILPEHRGNPLIEALPPKKCDQEVLDAFSHYPLLDDDIRYSAEPVIREEYLSRIGSLRQPLGIYLYCFRAIERAIKTGYSAKNPLSPTTAQYIHYLTDEMPSVEPTTGNFKPKGEGLTLIGESGVGKSCMLEQTLGYFPQMILHNEYNGDELNSLRQVVWLKVDCPRNASVRELCIEILDQINRITGFDDEKPPSRDADLQKKIEQKIKSCFLGILIIDEMQNLSPKRTQGFSSFIKYLHKIVNSLGIPIFFCANPPFDDTLSKTLKSARRAEGGGYFVMESPDLQSQEWDSFIKALWKYQWTNIPTPLTESLSAKLHGLSTGNFDLAHRIFREAQRLVMGSDDERITKAALTQACLDNCGLSLMSKEIEEKKGQKIDAIPSELNIRNAPPNSTKTSTQKPIADVTRPQHPEFSVSLIELMHKTSILSGAGDLELVRTTIEQEDKLEYLKRNNLLCDDPLSLFGVE